jgi:hypothetical protein
VGKNFYKCRTQTCKYWEWNESEEDAIKRKGGKAVKASTSIHNRKPYDRPKPAAVTRKCDCGQPALRLVAKNGMPHNIGRAFFKCRRSKCEFWVWEDGSLPFSEASQRRFNEWMDDQNGYCPYDDFDDPGDWDNDYDDVHESIFSFLF